MMVKALVSRVTWVAASLVALGGCVAETDSEEVDSAEEGVTSADSAAVAPQAASEEREGRRDRGKDRGAFQGKGGAHAKMRGGPEHLLGLAMKELELSDAQRGALEDALKSVHAPPGDKADHEAKAAQLAAAVRAGKVDPAALRPAAEPGDKHAERMERVAAALQVLHATLTPEQRSELVARARELREEHDVRGPKDHGPKGGAKGRAKGPGFGEAGPLGHLLRDVPLTDAQRTQIEEALEAKGLGKPKSPPDAAELAARHAARAEAASALLDAFAKDRFDAAKVLEAHKPAKEAHDGPPPFLEILATVVPILDAEQREALAVAIESGPARGPGKQGMFGKRGRAGR